MRPGANPAPGPLKPSDFIFPWPYHDYKLPKEARDEYDNPKYVRSYAGYPRFSYAEPLPAESVDPADEPVAVAEPVVVNEPVVVAEPVAVNESVEVKVEVKVEGAA
jgi:hypothetical protein